MSDNPTLIVPRRNFLVRALGFTVAGATLPISIITADDAQARMQHHRIELERAWRDYYGPGDAVRFHESMSPAGTVVDSEGHPPHLALSVFMICAGGGQVAS